MTSETRLAFAHPEARAEATAEDRPLDRISLRDHVIAVDIGAFQTERGHPQSLRFNVVVEVQPLVGPVEHDVDRILSYDRVAEAIAQELQDERLNLLETLAERVADRILGEPQAVRVFVRIEKLDRGPGDLGVEIVRTREGGQPAAAEFERLAPRVVFLSNAAIWSDRLSGWIDALQDRQGPPVLCVGPHEGAVPETGHRMTQRRIDLLAIEQNAWVLAARDHRCVVVSSRTELDWAMRNGQISVWAPSKIVLDALEAPPVQAEDPVALVQWFARTFGAREMLVIGADLPAAPETDETSGTPEDPEAPELPMRAIAIEEPDL